MSSPTGIEVGCTPPGVLLWLEHCIPDEVLGFDCSQQRNFVRIHFIGGLIFTHISNGTWYIEPRSFLYRVGHLLVRF